MEIEPYYFYESHDERLIVKSTAGEVQRTKKIFVHVLKNISSFYSIFLLLL